MVRVLLFCSLALVLAGVRATDTELAGETTRFPGMKVYYPNAFLQEGAEEDPAAHTGQAPAAAAELELIQLESKSKTEEQSATGKKVKMMCYCGSQKHSQSSSSGGFDTPYNPPAKVGYLRPFTHRLFDRRFGMPEKTQKWGEQKKSIASAHDEHDSRFSDESELPEEWRKKALSQTSSKATAKDAVFYDKRFGPPLQALRGAKKDGWYYALYPHDGDRDISSSYGNDPLAGDDQSGGLGSHVNCKSQEHKHPKLYSMMKDFFGGKMTADQCKFWRDYIGQMNKELGVSLSAHQIQTMGSLMHCVC